MNKNEILEKLRAAKTSHVNWVQKAKMLIEGIDINKDSIPVNATECNFGLWFYDDAQKLNALRNNPVEAMTKIENLHMQLHNKYLSIYKIYYTQDAGFFKKLFGRKKKIGPKDTIQAHDFFQELQVISEKLLVEINKLERRILTLAEEEIEKL